MAKYYIYIIFSLAFLLCSCLNKEEVPNTDNLVLNFSLQDNIAVKGTKADDAVTFENRVTHLDVFFFDGTNNNKIHYQRINADGNPSGEKIIDGITLAELKEIGSVKIYIAANSKLSVAQMENVDNIGELKTLKEETTYINLTGYTGFEEEMPQCFLMTGLGTSDSSQLPVEETYSGIDFSGIDPTESKNIFVRLVRAAAKVEMHFKLNDESNFIYAFGKPKKNAETEYTENELKDISLPVTQEYSYIHNSYYIRNLRYITPFWGEATQDKRKTNPITNSGYMVPLNEKEIKVTAYIYSYSWGGTDASSSVFEEAPFLIVNLPAVLYKDGGKTKGEYLERNYYEIPFRTKIEDGDDKFRLRRNNFYKITAKVDAPGAQTSMEPVQLTPIIYEVYPWNMYTVNVGGETNDVSYLSLSKEAIEMHNTTTNSEIKFASSHPITKVELVRAYYINKAGKEIDNKSNKNIKPTAEATTDALNGTITVTSEKIQGIDNVIMYMTFKVTNSNGLSKTFTVKQYPDVYIQGILGSFSYRTDFKADFLGVTGTGNNNNGYTCATWDNGNWKLGSTSNYTTFNSKKAGDSFDNNGHAAMRYYYWSYSSWRNEWQLNYRSNLQHNLNPRMYQITITSTSETYKIGRPLTDGDGYTVPTEENNQLVSPSFMIASGLGATQAMTAEAAKSHCNLYAEAYYDSNNNLVRLEDWRLPTEAEIKIINQYQNNSVAMDVLLTGNQYWCATGTAITIVGSTDSGDPKVRCVRDVYTPAK